MKHIKKAAALLLAVLLLLAGTAGCGTGAAESSAPSAAVSSRAAAQKTQKPVLRLAALKGPTGIGMLKLMSDNDAGKTANAYKISLATSPDQIVAKISSGDADAAAVPTNLAATLYNKTGGRVQLAAVNTLGVLYLLTSDPKIRAVKDLKGKTIASSGQGATPEYAVNYILKQNGLTPGKDVKVQYKAEHAELAALMISGKAATAVLPEPFVTQVLAKNPKIRIALDLTKEWEKASKGKSALAMGGLMVRRDFAEKNRAAFNKFLDEYKASAEYATANVRQTAALSGKYGIMPSAVAQKAIPNCSIVYIDGSGMKEKIPGFLKLLYEFNPKSVGGKLPKDDFYYQK